MRLIDADALQKVFKEECIQECSSCIYSKPWVRAEDGFGSDWQGCKLIDEAPAIITARTTVEGFPIIDMRPRNTGEWIELETNPKEFFGHRFYSCSNCGREIDVITPDESLDDYPYCHCGACMIKEGEK